MGDVSEQAESLGRKQMVHIDKCWMGSPSGACSLAKERSFLKLVAFLWALTDFCLLASFSSPKDRDERSACYC